MWRKPGARVDRRRRGGILGQKHPARLGRAPRRSPDLRRSEPPGLPPLAPRVPRFARRQSRTDMTERDLAGGDCRQDPPEANTWPQMTRPPGSDAANADMPAPTLATTA